MKNTACTREDHSALGFGLGLRPDHYETILQTQPAVDWFEILTENYLVPGGKPHYYLEKIRECYPLVMHGVSMSIGSIDEVDKNYLMQVKQLAKKIQPQWISDHLCWTGVQGKNTHDLLPLPYTEEVVEHVVDRIKRVQDFLEQRILIENISSYVAYKQSTMTEWDFLREISERADCFILLDINNIYVNSINYGFDPQNYLAAVPAERIRQIHLAGHSDNGEYLVDTHDQNIVQPVWDLYAAALRQFGFIPTMIERDDNIPPFDSLLAELNQVKRLTESILTESVK